MSFFLKKLESTNFRLRFIKISDVDTWSALENYTRIKSFILDGQFEIECTKWYKMYLYIVEFLQMTNPINLNRLLEIESSVGRCRPFSDSYKNGYLKTDFGLYLRDPGPVNKIVPSIKHMLKIFGFNPDDAYLVVELTPDCANEFSGDVIEEEKKELYDYLKRIYVDSDRFFDVSIRAIEEMNHSLQHYSSTTYNNLYLLNSDDYEKYANEAIEKQLSRANNAFTRSELSKVVEWLKDMRFNDGDYLNPTFKKDGDTFIVDKDKKIKVEFKTRFMEEVVHE